MKCIIAQEGYVRRKMKKINTKINSFLRLDRRLITFLFALILVVCTIVTSACGRQGLPPKLYTGDQWIYRQIQGNATYIRTETVLGEEKIENTDCYIVNVAIVPAFDDWIPGWTEWRDKKTYSTFRVQFSASNPLIGNQTLNRLIVYSSEVTGSEWPYRVGNEFTINESWTRTDVVADSNVPQTGESITTWKVTNIEEIETGSGNLTCFKTIGYQGGNATFEYWYSDKAKAYVKHINPITDELVSYSLR